MTVPFDSFSKVLGFRSLKIVSEEFAAPREDVSMQRKDELKKLLLNQVPTVLRIITGQLIQKVQFFLCLGSLSKGFHLIMV